MQLNSHGLCCQTGFAKCWFVQLSTTWQFCCKHKTCSIFRRNQKQIQNFVCKILIAERSPKLSDDRMLVSWHTVYFFHHLVVFKTLGITPKQKWIIKMVSCPMCLEDVTQSQMAQKWLSLENVFQKSHIPLAQDAHTWRTHSKSNFGCINLTILSSNFMVEISPLKRSWRSIYWTFTAISFPSFVSA